VLQALSCCKTEHVKAAFCIPRLPRNICRIHVSDIFEKYISHMQMFKALPIFVALSFCSKFLLCSGFVLLALGYSGTAIPAGWEQADLRLRGNDVLPLNRQKIAATIASRVSGFRYHGTRNRAQWLSAAVLNNRRWCQWSKIYNSNYPLLLNFSIIYYIIYAYFIRIFNIIFT